MLISLRLPLSHRGLAPHKITPITGRRSRNVVDFAELDDVAGRYAPLRSQFRDRNLPEKVKELLSGETLAVIGHGTFTYFGHAARRSRDWSDRTGNRLNLGKSSHDRFPTSCLASGLSARGVSYPTRKGPIGARFPSGLVPTCRARMHRQEYAGSQSDRLRGAS